VDLSVDLGEEPADEAVARAAGLLPFVTSVNVACGFHAGGPATMDRVVRAAAGAGVAVGAHPSYDDREGFGRRALTVPAERLRADLLYQLGALDAFARAWKTRLTHVKLHGALYHQAAESADSAAVVVSALAAFGAPLVLVGPCTGHALRTAAAARGIRYAAEAFADRRYDPEGRLLPRSHPQALVVGPQAAAEQALAIAIEQRAAAVDGRAVTLQAETIGFHADTPGAAAIARAVRHGLEAAGVPLAPLAP